jgi:hypothetical protein
MRSRGRHKETPNTYFAVFKFLFHATQKYVQEVPIFKDLLSCSSRDSAVGLATGYGFDD